MYPEYMEINGVDYKIDTDYRVALACFRAINDDEINDTQRTLAVVTLLLGEDFPIELINEGMEKCTVFLRCGKEENQDEEDIDMDYEQDMGRIMASFRSCYNMDIQNEKIHWWAFNDYIAGFGEDEILSRVRYIRNYNLNDIKDANEREKMAEAQNRLAIVVKERKTEKQKELDKFWDKITGGE